MKTLKIFLIATLLTVGSMSLANAQTRFHVSVNTPGVHIGVGNYQPYYHRVYYAPAPVYYNDAPVYYNSAPVYYNDDNCYNSYPYGYRSRVVYRNYYRSHYRPYYHRNVVVYHRGGGHRRW